MEPFLQPQSTLETLFESTTNYVETNIEIAKLKAIKKGAQIGTTIILKTIVAVFFAMGIMVLNISAGLWLGSILGQSYYGFLVLGVFYILVGLVLYLCSEKWLQIPMINSIIKKLND